MKENVKNEVKEKPKKKSKIGLIILIIIIILLAGVIIFITPKIKEVGIGGIFDFTKLNKEETKYYELYVDALSKYKDACEEGYKCSFSLHYLEKVEEPVVVVEIKDIDGSDSYADKTSIAYIKNDKVIINDYDTISSVDIIYNTEKDEIDYYLYQENIDNHSTSYTLLKDIVTESDNPYTYTFGANDSYSTTYRDSGERVSISMSMALFIGNLNNYQDNKVYDQHFSFNEGEQSFRRFLKKAIASKYYLKDLLTNTARETALEKISYYNIKPGQQILGNYSNTSTNQNQNNNKNPNNTQSQKPTSKCNEGFVYVSDDNRCYSNTDVKNQINRCQPGEIDLDGDCGTAVDGSLCASNPDQYIEIAGKCIDKYTVHTQSIECPEGYDILFGSYSGKEFNGACYRNVSPNK